MRLIHSLVEMRGVFPQTRLSTGVVDNYCGQVGKKCAMVQKKTPTLWQAGVFFLISKHIIVLLSQNVNI